jgi:hypothetical protein
LSFSMYTSVPRMAYKWMPAKSEMNTKRITILEREDSKSQLSRTTFFLVYVSFEIPTVSPLSTDVFRMLALLPKLLVFQGSITSIFRRFVYWLAGPLEVITLRLIFRNGVCRERGYDTVCSIDFVVTYVVAMDEQPVSFSSRSNLLVISTSSRPGLLQMPRLRSRFAT